MISTTTTMSKRKDNNPETIMNLSISNPQPSTPFVPNGIKYEISDDIELISLHSLTYTSLRDILPPNRSPSSSIMSPTNSSSWYEIPIKNPLVKQAALSYLQPMSMPPESEERGFFSRVKDKCCCIEFGGCFAFFKDVIVWRLKNIFRERIDSDYDDCDDEDDYDDDYEYNDRDDDKID